MNSFTHANQMRRPVPDDAGQPTRTIHCADAVAWLSGQPPLAGCSLITSLPDVSELPDRDLDGWKRWFVSAASLAMSKIPDEGVAIFYQTDIKKQGVWVDKGYLCHKAAEEQGLALLWHKIVCRKPVGTITFGRPAYSHLLCYARTLRADLGKATADVLPSPGEMTWTRAMGVEACLVACRFVLAHTSTRTILDPFCGKGTALAVANALGMDAIGVEIAKKRARQAKGLQVNVGQPAPPPPE